MEHITFKGTTAYPSTRAISEAIEGVGGSFNAATDRESTVYWVRVPRREAERAMDVIGELIVRPRLDERRDRERADGHHRGDPLVPRRPVRVLPDPVPDRDVRRRAARSRDLRRRGRHPGAARRRPSATSGGRRTGRPTRSSPSPATSTTTRRSTSPATAFGTGQRRDPGLRAGAGAARRAARPDRQARHEPGAARASASRRSTATIPTAGRWPSSTPSSATG